MKDFDELLALEENDDLTHVRDEFETYFEEAKFFLPIMQKHFQSIKPKSVAEIGSGLGLLAMILSREVENFAAFEPSSAGFEKVRNAQKVLDDQLEHNVFLLTTTFN